jgi:hypothetical protein
MATVATAIAGMSAGALAGETNIGGKMYWDFTSKDIKSNGVKQDGSGFGVDVKRFYVGITHAFDDQWSVNVTTDFNYVSSDGETQVFIKKAYIQDQFNKNLKLRLGSADMPWIPFAEHVYEYRFLENTIIDRLHYGNSADWGAHVLGSGDNGMFNYQVSAVNGGGYKHPGRSKGMDFEGRVAFKTNGLTIGLGGYSGNLGNDQETAPSLHTASRIDFIAGYRQANKFNVGVEYFSADNWKNVTTVASDSADGYSLFGNMTVSGKTQVFARYDKTNPSKDLNSNLEDKYFNVGVSFVPADNVIFAVAYKNEKLQDGAAIDVKTDEIGVWTQVKF